MENNTLTNYPRWLVQTPSGLFGVNISQLFAEFRDTAQQERSSLLTPEQISGLREAFGVAPAQNEKIAYIDLSGQPPDYIFLRYMKSEELFEMILRSEQPHMIIPWKIVGELRENQTPETCGIMNRFLAGRPISMNLFNQIRNWVTDHEQTIQQFHVEEYNEFIMNLQRPLTNIGLYMDFFTFNRFCDPNVNRRGLPYSLDVIYTSDAMMYESTQLDAYLQSHHRIVMTTLFRNSRIPLRISKEMYLTAKSRLVEIGRDLVNHLTEQGKLPSMMESDITQRRLEFKNEVSTPLKNEINDMNTILKLLWRQLPRNAKVEIIRKRATSKEIDDVFQKLPLDERLQVEKEYMIETGETFFSPYLGAPTYRKLIPMYNVIDDDGNIIEENTEGQLLDRSLVHGGQEFEEPSVFAFINNPTFLDARNAQELERILESTPKETRADGHAPFFIYDGMSPFHAAMAEYEAVPRILHYIEQTGKLPINQFFVQEIKAVWKYKLLRAAETYRLSQ